MNKQSKIYVAGHTGLIGSTILKKLQQDGFVILFAKLIKN